MSSPVASIPRVKIMAYIRGYSGAVTQVRIPTMSQSVRPGALALTVAPAVANNMFTIATAAVAPATVTADLYRINRRYTLITSIVAREVTGGGATIDTTVAYNHIYLFYSKCSFKYALYADQYDERTYSC